MNCMRFALVSLVLSTIVLGYNAYKASQENQKLSIKNLIYEAETRILKDEIKDYVSKPTYEDGYKTALIKMGGPQNPGAYQDGWDDAYKVFCTENGNGYSVGYHTAIEQFGYTMAKSSNRWLVPETLANK